MRTIERYTNTKIHRGKVPTVTEVEEARANVFLDKIRATLRSGEFKRQDHLVERLLEEGFSSTDIASALMSQLQDGESVPAARPREEVQPERFSRDRDRDHDRRRPDFRDRDRAEQRPRFEKRVRREDRATGELPPPKPAPASLKAHGDKLEEASKIVPAKIAAPKPPHKKASRKTPAEQTRLWLNLGEDAGIKPIDVVNAVAGETGLPGNVVGTVDIRERHAFVDVDSGHVHSIVSKLNRAEIKGRRIKAKVA